jgi:hypothetical protein
MTDPGPIYKNQNPTRFPDREMYDLRCNSYYIIIILYYLVLDYITLLNVTEIINSIAHKITFLLHRVNPIGMSGSIDRLPTLILFLIEHQFCNILA